MTDVLTAPLSELTTLRLGGPAQRLVEARSAARIIDAVRDADGAGRPLLLVGGGSNLVVADAGFAGTALLLRSRGVEVAASGDEVLLRVQAGESWDELVARTVAEGWSGIECLAGIPGCAGATPVQNVGAYGQEVAETVTSVLVWDREQSQERTLSGAECRFAYRTSIFKHSDRFVVLSVSFRLQRDRLSRPIKYAELAKRLGVPAGAGVPLDDVRQTVLDLRRGKGMVLDADDHDTWSAGSFFTNPVLPDVTEFETRLPAGTSYPRFPAPEGTKLSAAWLIGQAGFTRGFGEGAIRLSTKHTLALTNRGGGTTAGLLDLARTIRDGVRDRFGIELVPEPRLVGVSL